MVPPIWQYRPEPLVKCKGCATYVAPTDPHSCLDTLAQIAANQQALRDCHGGCGLLVRGKSHCDGCVSTNS